MDSRLEQMYREQVVPAMVEKFGYENSMQVPKLDKVVVNMGLGDCKDNTKLLEAAVNDLATITGQAPLVTKAKKSVANFKVRQGQNVGAKVTLRKQKMYDFVDKLFNIALPRVRDFQGLSNDSFDGRGNYAFGVREQLIFPEIEYDKVEKIRGMDIQFITTAETDEEAHELLRLMGLPYKREENNG